jgi:hypothetical protein
LNSSPTPWSGARGAAEALESRTLLHGADDGAGDGAGCPCLAGDVPGEVATNAAPAPSAAPAAGDPLLPDLVPLSGGDADYLGDRTVDVATRPAHTLLRFTSAVINRGAGPVDFHLIDNPERTQRTINQRIFNGGGFSERLVGVFPYDRFSIGFLGFWTYRLRALAADGGPGEVVASNDRDSHCLKDHVRPEGWRPGSPGVTTYVTCTGLSVGWAARYSSIGPNQWVDVTEVRDGRYWLEVEVDPYNRVLEADETNNVVRVLVDLDLPSSDPSVVAQTPSGQQPYPVSSLDFRFDQPLDPEAFSVADDVLQFVGPGGVDLRGAITGVAWPRPDTLRVSFSEQSAEGAYVMLIGPRLSAADNGHPMDQDRDERPGETNEDRYAATFTIDPCIGPDGFGYVACASPYEPIDLVEGAPGVFRIVQQPGDGTEPVDLGNNTFSMYGEVHSGPTSLYVGENGLITFGSGYGDGYNIDLTRRPGQRAISPLWDDWTANHLDDDRVLGRFDDVTGDGSPDRLVIEWSKVRPLPYNDGPVTFQAILQLNTGSAPGEVIFNYVNILTANEFANGGSATVGIKDVGDAPPAPRLLVSYDRQDSPFLGNQKAIRIRYDAPPATIAARHVFYNNSFFDGKDPAANASDDAAIDPGKSALLPGQRATFSNFTSYSRGLNGVMVDVAGLHDDVSAADFLFRVGDGENPATWAVAPPPASVTLRRGAGEGGSDRVTLVWPDGSIARQWLQVTVLPSERTGVAAADVFYFGNLPGKVADPSPGGVGGALRRTAVTALDLAAVRRNLSRGRTPVNSLWDVDRDGIVGLLDVLSVRRAYGSALTLLTA